MAQGSHKAKFLLSSIGTRGDIEPFMAIAEILREHDHEVICLFPEQFRGMVEDAGFAFESLGMEFIEMIESDVGKAALGGSATGLKKLLAYFRLGRVYGNLGEKLVQRQHEVVHRVNPDRIVHNGKVIYPIIWNLVEGGKNTLVSPVPYVLQPVKERPHVAFTGNFGPFLNKLTYKLGLFGLAKTVMKSTRILRIDAGISPSKILKSLIQSHTIYTISPSIFQRPSYWPPQVQVLGYHERDRSMQWQPEAALRTFLDENDRVLLVTFGSMTNPTPVEKTQLILDVLEKHQIPALINTAGGGLVKPEVYNEKLFHFVDQIPYEWILPRVYAVMHHGGSGTTHMVLKNACASLIIPHIIDQYLWDEILSQKGLGPAGVSIARMTVANLEPRILDLMGNSSYKQSAREISEKMGGEGFLRAKLYETLTA